LLAFASGALISALAFELFEEAFHLGGAWRSGVGLLAGATVFVITDSLLDRYVAGHPGPEQREVTKDAARGGVGWAQASFSSSCSPRRPLCARAD
jgi:ZIP family zinc transporter